MPVCVFWTQNSFLDRDVIKNISLKLNNYQEWALIHSKSTVWDSEVCFWLWVIQSLLEDNLKKYLIVNSVSTVQVWMFSNNQHQKSCIFYNAFSQILLLEISVHHSMLPAANKKQISFSWYVTPRVNLYIVNEDCTALVSDLRGIEIVPLSQKTLPPTPLKKK